MYTLDRVSSFIKSFIEDEEGYLGRLYEDAVGRGIPVMRPETKELLKTQLILHKPTKLLEIGTAVGFSALYMSEHVAPGATITTLELSPERVKEARANIKAMGRESQIRVIEGDAAVTLKELPSDSFDFAFVDAAKGQYIYYYPEVMRLVRSGGLIISDNILQDGDVLESHFLVEKRNRTIHDRMREYLYTITHDERVDTALLSVGDGVAISVKR
ncbi:MAG: O-methyltransferase [Lachnospiraceae bacterium]|nr:O-methyltransferase [Lachnospiraceae bacterium]